MKKGQLDDPKNLTKDMSGQGHWGNGDYVLRLSPNDELDYVMFLITQSYIPKSIPLIFEIRYLL